jgi:DNA-binding beta-propeller fold protein YncE
MRKTSVLPLAIALSITAVAHAEPASPYHLAAVTPLPSMPEGDFDQLDADVARGRLYVSAEDGAAMDVFDLKSGALIRSGGDVTSPHKVVVDRAANRLFVADSDAGGSVKVLDSDLKTVARIPVGAKPDTGFLDAKAHIFYVGSRNGGSEAKDSIVSAISTESFAILRTFTVPATTLKGMTMDADGHRLFVSMRDKNQIGVIHLDDGRVEVWSPKDLHKSVPLAFDAPSHLLLAGSRQPGKLDVLDVRDGEVRATLPSTATSDSMSFDAEGRILYVSGDSGMSRYHVGEDGKVTFLSTDPAVVGKTSIFVPQLRRLYVMRPRKGDVVAALQVFDVK